MPKTWERDNGKRKDSRHILERSSKNRKQSWEIKELWNFFGISKRLEPWWILRTLGYIISPHIAKG